MWLARGCGCWAEADTVASNFGPPRVCRDAGNFEGFTPVPEGELCPWLQDWRR